MIFLFIYVIILKRKKTLYFISYFFAGSFDVSLSLYVLFLIAGIGKLKKINFTEIVAGVWLLVYTVVGIVHQDAYMTIASVVTRYAYIIVYICVVCAEEIRVVKETEAADYRYFVRTGLITEALIVIMVWLRDRCENRYEPSAGRRGHCAWDHTDRGNLLPEKMVHGNRNDCL